MCPHIVSDSAGSDVWRQQQRMMLIRVEASDPKESEHLWSDTTGVLIRSDSTESDLQHSGRPHRVGPLCSDPVGSDTTMSVRTTLTPCGPTLLVGLNVDGSLEFGPHAV
jgi:hypothetical protein